MNKIYHSNLFDKVQDPETGLYRESPAYVYGLLVEEFNLGRIEQREV